MWENLFIGVAGMIGAGKSTLAKALGEHLGLDVHYEPVADNEYLEDFYRDTHRLIYRAVMELYKRGEEVDVVTLSAQLDREGVLERAGGREFVHTLAEFVPAAANAVHYAGIVREQSVLRALIKAGNGYEVCSQKGWKEPTLQWALPRFQNAVLCVQGCSVPYYWRLFPELAICGGARGICRIGADSWEGVCMDGWQGGCQRGFVGGEQDGHSLGG